MFAIAGMLLAITVRTVSPTQDRINTHIYTRTQAHAQGTKKVHQTKMTHQQAKITHHRMLENYLNILKSMSNKQSGANFKISLCKARKKTCAAHLSLCQR